MRGQHQTPSPCEEGKPRAKKLRHLCNPPDRIQRNQEGVLPSQYQLSGIVILLRHGDRGPLVHVRNLSSINCGYHSYGTPTYKKYVGDILNVSRTNAYVNFVGPFVRFPLLPPPSHCGLGHLTPQGVLQHLQLGKVLSQVYLTEFNLLGNRWGKEDIVVYCTKYRRTFQSVLAFLYSFIPNFEISKVRLQEGRGVSFCGDNCHCEQSDHYDQKYEQERRDYRRSHPGIVDLVHRINPLVREGEDITSPLVMRDALLSYVCHGASLPCLDGRCVKVEDVTGLVSYEEWEGRQKRTSSQRKAAKLKVYGLLRSISEALNSMMGDSRPRVVVYSGHDRTLKYLLDTFGVPNYQLPHYASRLVLELYQNTSATPTPDYHTTYFFRMVYNGKDITKFVPFCESVTIRQLKSGNVKRGAISLCSVGKLVNYLRPDLYFKEFNAASFSNACQK
ncbi:2-phosphoxylose phosphatase 1 [Chionoecetes opilio]|uniref:2-phosphoxylose phosphatase 1 n=1 Tax=Chionoecetes opilio TaxID=41210 RepID=A0A8J5CMR6_CHIOP|nr:2-phosphoxylose phosphatase 1 [Chionoecetes opilio]KAG0716135.1 2-phosphoxylose phosphatase 1 [Chionoecetes opilio]